MQPPPGRVFNTYRKIWHMLGLIIPLFLYFDPFSDAGVHATRTMGVWLLLFLILLAFGLDIARITLPGFRKFWYRHVGFLMKAEEAGYFNATIPYLAACLILFLTSRSELALIACMFLMVGDPVAALVGGRYGRVRFYNGKSLEGMAAFILSGWLAALFFLWLHTQFASAPGFYSLQGFPLRLALTTLAGAFVAAVAEFFSFTALNGLFDDNLSVPVAGALGFGLAGYFAYAPLDEMFMLPLFSFF
jgi:dolichol kinase